MPGNKLLEVPPNVVQNIRKMYNLDGPGRMEEAIDILKKWLNQERHILKKDFSKEYLEWSIITSKGSLEKAKKQIDRLCTLKTLLPVFFVKRIVKEELKAALEQGCITVMPKLTEDFYRIEIVKLYASQITEEIFLKYCQSTIAIAEYVRAHDYVTGFIMLYDLQGVNLMDVIPKINPVMLQQLITIIKEGYGGRVKEIHLLTESKAVDVLVKLVKQFISEKLSKRFFVHKNLKELHAAIPKDLLPDDYDGKQKSVEKFTAEWLKALSSKEHVEYLEVMSKACTDESLRQSDKFNAEYMGMPGSFRNLKVD